MRNYIQLVLAACALATPLLAHAAPTSVLPRLWLRILDDESRTTEVKLYVGEGSVRRNFPIGFSTWKEDMELMCDKDQDGDAFCLKLSPNGSSDARVNTVAEIRYKGIARRCALSKMEIPKNPFAAEPDQYDCTIEEGAMNA